jgi:hypothetical protein
MKNPTDVKIIGQIIHCEQENQDKNDRAGVHISRSTGRRSTSHTSTGILIEEAIKVVSLNSQF